ncbi:single-stranded DNA-binding protein [Intestinimonas butyriciproducens]|uniref:single-stranded DNA-binding protein n=1 Tax=Intestinimonas butyriciproducens TaxID=1297617 RepID=UPI00242E44B2
MLNKTTMMGRLTHDPELRRTQTDTPVCSFSIACERDFKNADGGRDTDFFDCVAWRQTAEFVSQYFTKGRMAIVEGRLQNREWTDKEGHKRRATELIVSNVYFGDSKPKEEGDGAPPAYAGTPMSIAGGGIPANFTPNFADFQEDGELPF